MVLEEQDESLDLSFKWFAEQGFFKAVNAHLVDLANIHPGQRIERKPDGSVVVRFRAGGKEDMARHLVGWWDWVERIRPRELRRTVLRMRLAGLAPLVEEFADRETADRIRELAGELGATQVTSAGESGPGR